MTKVVLNVGVHVASLRLAASHHCEDAKGAHEDHAQARHPHKHGAEHNEHREVTCLVFIATALARSAIHRERNGLVAHATYYTAAGGFACRFTRVIGNGAIRQNTGFNDVVQVGKVLMEIGVALCLNQWLSSGQCLVVGSKS